MSLPARPLRSLIRRFKPGHPLGHLGLGTEAQEGGGFRVFSTGLEALSLPNLEMCCVPVDLVGPVKDLMTALVRSGEWAGATPLPDTGRTIVARLVSRFQPVPHRLRLVPAVAAGAAMARIVDVGDESGSAGFPARLMAIHLISLADRCRNPVAAEGFFRRAIEVYPGEECGVPHAAAAGPGPENGETREQEGQEGNEENENNCLAYYGLANALGDHGAAARALELTRTAVKKGPRWAKRNQDRIRQAVPPREQPGIVDPLARFWLDTRIP